MLNDSRMLSLGHLWVNNIGMYPFGPTLMTISNDQTFLQSFILLPGLMLIPFISLPFRSWGKLVHLFNKWLRISFNNVIGINYVLGILFCKEKTSLLLHIYLLYAFPSNTSSKDMDLGWVVMVVTIGIKLGLSNTFVAWLEKVWS